MDKPTKFPDLSEQHIEALTEKTIKLDGQKVLFDKKVRLMPIALEKKKNKNGAKY